MEMDMDIIHFHCVLFKRRIGSLVLVETEMVREWKVLVVGRRDTWRMM